MRTWTPVLWLAAMACSHTANEGTCPGVLEVRNGEPLEMEILYQGDTLYADPGWDTGVIWPQGLNTIDDADAAADFEAATGIVLADRDMDSYQVAVLTVRVSSTCGLYLEEVTARRIGGQDVPHVDATFVDSSGSCGYTCDMEQGLGVVVAVEHAGPQPTTACARLEGR